MRAQQWTKQGEWVTVVVGKYRPRVRRIEIEGIMRAHRRPYASKLPPASVPSVRWHRLLLNFIPSLLSEDTTPKLSWKQRFSRLRRLPVHASISLTGGQASGTSPILSQPEDAHECAHSSSRSYLVKSNPSRDLPSLLCLVSEALDRCLQGRIRTRLTA